MICNCFDTWMKACLSLKNKRALGTNKNNYSRATAVVQLPNSPKYDFSYF